MLNNVSIMGRLTADPELKYTQSDIAVTSFTLAVERDFKNANNEKETDFIDFVAWRKTAEFICNYFHKGQLAAVTGSIQTRKYEDKDGNTRKAVEIVANNIYFAESKKDSETSDESRNTSNTVDNNDSSDDFDPFSSDASNNDDLPF